MIRRTVYAVSIVAPAVLAGPLVCGILAPDKTPPANRSESRLEPPKRRTGHPVVGHLRYILDTTISGDGRTLVSCSRDRTVRIWDLKTGREVVRAEDRASDTFPSYVDVDAGLRRVVTAGPALFWFDANNLGPGRHESYFLGSAVKIWDARSGKLLRTLTLGDLCLPNGVAVSRDGRRVACVDVGFSAKLWDATSGRLITSIDGRTRQAAACFDVPNHRHAFSDDATRYVALTADKDGQPDAIFACDVAAQRQHRIPPPAADAGRYEAVALSADGEEVAAWADGGNANASVSIFDFTAGRLKRRLPTPGFRDVRYFAYVPEREVLVLGTREGRLYVCNSKSGSRMVDTEAGDGPIRAVAILPDRVRVVAGSGHDNVIQRTPVRSLVAEPLTLTDLLVRLSP
jgi:WD40 repeat protein